MTKRQEEKLQAAENWARRICKVKREDIKKMEELRVEIGTKTHLNMKIVVSRLRWAGHIQRMSEERLTKRAVEGEEEDRN